MINEKKIDKAIKSVLFSKHRRWGDTQEVEEAALLRL